MSISSRLNTVLVSTLLLAAGTFFSTSALAIGISGSSIPASGEPAFTHNVTIAANPKGRNTPVTAWTISGRDGFTLTYGGMVYNGTNSQYRLLADFDKQTGALVGGSLTISGKLPDFNITSTATLVTADIIGFDFNAAYDDTLIGFRTDNIICSALLGFACTTSESVWIQLDSAFNGDTTARMRNSGLAITTVPVPAAVWLFGSGLAFLGVAGKRRRKAA